MRPPPGYRPVPALPPRLDPGAATRPGVSLVTACRDRNANLVAVLPGWLRLDLAEIVVVDWSSATPVTGTLADAGIDDPRIRVVRVEGEARWCLSQAFNAGFRLAGHTAILKADADIELAADFLDRNPLPGGAVVGGNWRRAAPGQQYVNGVFYLHRADLARVNGFNEYITTYGWDDDDLYDRLRDAGLDRIDVAPGTVRHLDHDDAARLGARPDGSDGPDGPVNPASPVSGWADLRARPIFAIRSNRFLATMMPAWDTNRTMLPLGWLDGGPDGPDGPGGKVLARAGDSPHVAPGHLRARAEWLAAWELLSWRAGLRVFELEEAGLDRLLRCRRLDAITDLHVELALAGAGSEILAAPRHLVADLDLPALAARPEAAAPLHDRLAALARETGRVPVLRAHRVPAGPGGLDRLPLVPAAHPLGPAAAATLGTATGDLVSPVLAVPVTAEEIVALAPPAPPTPAPMVARPGADRIVIDAQHGLGNRMRAIGSAAAIAGATGRELVIAWRPDSHCGAALHDLFETDCAVTETESMAAALDRGDSVLNGMETGPGAAKGAPLILEPGRDAYLRSAYVTVHPASHWTAENAALRAVLRPHADLRAQVRELAPGAGFDVGLHVRMETAGGTFDAADNWSAEGHAAILHWRGQSHYARFMTRLDAYLARWDSAAPPRLFLAADRAETRAAFARRYGDRIVMRADDGADDGAENGADDGPDPGRDRSAAALRGALVEMLALAQSRRLLASPWSSFGEVALRLSTQIRAHERAGLDF